jgi:hypothetical protein
MMPSPAPVVQPLLLDEGFHAAVADLLELPELHTSRTRLHHFDLSEYDHLLQVAQTAHRVSRVFRADARVCARAGLLHDLGAHWFNTVAPLALAVRLEEPPSVCHAIRAHTLLPVLPRTREAWAVVAADLLTTARECRFVLGRASKRARQRVRVPVRIHNLRARVPLAVLFPQPFAMGVHRRLELRHRFSPFVGIGPGPFVRTAEIVTNTIN